MHKFCKKYGEDELLYLLPNNGTSEKQLRYKLFRHLLYDDERRTLLCFIPKVPKYLYNHALPSVVFCFGIMGDHYRQIPL